MIEKKYSANSDICTIKGRHIETLEGHSVQSYRVCSPPATLNLRVLATPDL